MKKKTHLITEGALIAVLYVCATLLSSYFGLASGVIQVRISEAFTIVPAFTVSGIWGVFIGCLISNLITGAALWDVVFGSLASLIGAFLTYRYGKTAFRAAIFPIVSNTAIIPIILKTVYGFPGSIFYFILTVFIGEFISCGILGTILYKALKKTRIFTK